METRLYKTNTAFQADFSAGEIVPSAISLISENGKEGLYTNNKMFAFVPSTSISTIQLLKSSSNNVSWTAPMSYEAAEVLLNQADSIEGINDNNIIPSAGVIVAALDKYTLTTLMNITAVRIEAVLEEGAGSILNYGDVMDVATEVDYAKVYYIPSVGTFCIKGKVDGVVSYITDFPGIERYGRLMGVPDGPFKQYYPHIGQTYLDDSTLTVWEGKGTQGLQTI